MTEELPLHKYNSKLKAFTIVATSATILACLLADWEKNTGGPNIFSGVRPTVKAFFNELYGVRAPPKHSGTPHD